MKILRNAARKQYHKCKRIEKSGNKLQNTLLVSKQYTIFQTNHKRNNKMNNRSNAEKTMTKKNALDRHSNEQQRPFWKLCPVPFENLVIQDEFWTIRQEVNRKSSIFTQYKHLERQGHVDNYRITADEKKGVTKGLFYLDSDLYKWLEGASNMLMMNPNPELLKKVNYLVDLIQKSQTSDGYVNTFFTTKFLEKRFTTTHVTHELYCAGHLFQAAIAYYKATGNKKLVQVAQQFADLLVDLYLIKQRKGVPGHEEIEMALIELYRITEKPKYLKLAERFLNRRGNIEHFKTYALNQYIETALLLREAEKIRQTKLEDKKNKKVNQINNIRENEIKKSTEESIDEEPPEYLRGMTLKDAIILLKENLNGKAYQLHKSIRKMHEPVGHAVRAMYLYCGMADLYAEHGEKALLNALENIWLKMVKARMYITGGTGSVKSIEGFGKDFALDPAKSYSETCAAIGNLMWNWRMLQITAKAKYADLIERLFYNGMLVGQSIDGLKYTYTNPLKSFGKDTRHKWFICACCPPNIARTISSIGNYIYSQSEKGLFVHQYIGNTYTTKFQNIEVHISLKSDFPWKGKVKIELKLSEPLQYVLFLRIPSWALSPIIKINGSTLSENIITGQYFKLKKKWGRKTVIELDFHMKPQIQESDPRIKATQGLVAIQHGPLIYCMEQIDNPDIDIFKVRLSQTPNFNIDYRKDLLNGINIITADTVQENRIKMIPYYAWCNRGPNKMLIWMRQEKTK